MQKVKICGITNYEDAIMSIEAGADALGFVFYPESPRYITPESAKSIIEKLPPFVEKVGLFVNIDAVEINSIAITAGITLVQLHFDTDTTLERHIALPFLKVLRPRTKEELSDLDRRHYYLVDAYSELYGGSGKQLNLDWFNGIDCSHIILAGGLTPDNVKKTLPFNFYGVDVSSGTESVKGKKDPEKVKMFIREAKSC